MFSSRTRRWLLSTAAFAIALPWAPNSPSPQTAQAAAAESPAPKSPTEKGATTSGDAPALPPGIDISKLDDFGRKVFYRVVKSEPSACGKGESLLDSAKRDLGCRASFYAVRYVARLVDSGFTDSEIGEKLEKRFRSERHPRIDLQAAPSKGAPTARVTIVEFVDYECPHCRHAQTLLLKLVEDYPNDVRVYFKHFPLDSHPNARLAAEAAVAAHKQGKFWPFSDKVWTNSDSLGQAKLEWIAKQVGLDLTRWRADKDSEAVKNRVQDDKTDGKDLGVQATPSIYINGRKCEDALEISSIKDWVDEELGR